LSTRNHSEGKPQLQDTWNCHPNEFPFLHQYGKPTTAKKPEENMLKTYFKQYMYIGEAKN